MFGIGAQELMIIFLIVLLLFGANRIPEIARGLGKGIRDFKKATREIDDEVRLSDDDRRRLNERPASTPHATPPAPETTSSRPAQEKSS
jgi:sec-independent protein translocase protein TatA